MQRRTAPALLLLVAGCATMPAARPEATTSAVAMRAEVIAMMDASAAAWNRGDLDAFMRDYLPGQRTTYVGSRGVVRGPETIRASYERSYFAPGRSRDSLSFEGVEVDSLAPRTAYVIAFYVLSRGDSVVARGPTTLVMERHDGRWVIVHDHSS